MSALTRESLKKVQEHGVRVRHRSRAAMCVLPGGDRPRWLVATGPRWWSVRVGEEEDDGADAVAVSNAEFKNAVLVVHRDQEVRCYDPKPFCNMKPSTEPYVLKSYMQETKTMYSATAVTVEYKGTMWLESVKITGDRYWADSYDAYVWSLWSDGKFTHPTDAKSLTRRNFVPRPMSPVAHSTLLRDVDDVLFPEHDLEDGWCGRNVLQVCWRFDIAARDMPSARVV